MLLRTHRHGGMQTWLPLSLREALRDEQYTLVTAAWNNDYRKLASTFRIEPSCG